MNAMIQEPTRALRDANDADDIRAKIGPALEGFQPYFNQILLAIFVRPEKTKSGIFLSDTTLQEDLYQGKAGLVLKKGPMAFTSDERNDFAGLDVSEGDWVVIRPSDGFSLKLGGLMCRVVEDVHIKARIADPLSVY
jgi:co-chaperonin GroES (HSP10)